MEEVYANIDDVKTLSSRSSTIQEGPRRLLRASVLGLGLPSVCLLAGLIGLAVHYHNSVRGAAADLSAVKANLTERLQASHQQLSSVTEERERLKANLTERLQASDQQLSSMTEERDRLKANLTEKTKEVDRLQCLMDEAKTCPVGWKKLNCSCYLLPTEEASWEQSRQDCRARGAHLVIVDSYEEQEFITGMIKHQTWIGLNDINQEGTWKWVDGTPLTLKYWGSTLDNGGSLLHEEDCASLVHGRETRRNWNDLHCTARLQWICEKMA